MKHGPEILNDGKVKFNLWAPSAANVELVLHDKTLPMQAQNGWYELTTSAVAGDKYKFRINNKLEIPDPASHLQDGDVDDASIIVADDFNWHDWQTRPWEETVIYELHIGTFSEKGTYQGVEEKLDYLISLGITAIELMPIADFKGKRGWGYDGVLPYAPDTSYGTPQELKNLINAAHRKGLMVYLDVVYNHFGPAGNYLHEYAKNFFTEKYQTPWGAAIDFENSKEVRGFFIQNALYWLKEFHFDGLRFDAVHAITDNSSQHFLNDLAAEIRREVPQAHLILENDKNQSRFLGGENFNAQWNDDIHHVLHVLLSGETNGYYQDYKTQPLQQLGRCLTEGFAYQNDPSPMRQGELRGEDSRNLPLTSFINFMQNHDQIGNRAFGDRLSSNIPGNALQMSMALLLLSPSIPMLFMGEEWGSKTPFQYFCDFDGELADAVREGRRKEFSSFAEFADEEKRQQIPDPNAEKTFLNSKLNWAELKEPLPHEHYLHVTELLALRKKHIIPLLKSGCEKSAFELIDDKAIKVKWLFKNGQVLNILANFSINPAPIRLSDTNIWDNSGGLTSGWQCAVTIGDSYA